MLSKTMLGQIYDLLLKSPKSTMTMRPATFETQKAVVAAVDIRWLLFEACH